MMHRCIARSIVPVLSIVVAVATGCATREGYSGSVKARTVRKTSTDVAGKAIRYPVGGKPEVTGLLVEIPAGQNTGWHLHPVPCVAYILQGEVTVEDATGTRRRFSAGDSFAELVNLRHCGFNTGSGPVKLVMFAMGETGTPIVKRFP